MTQTIRGARSLWLWAAGLLALVPLLVALPSGPALAGSISVPLRSDIPGAGFEPAGIPLPADWQLPSDITGADLHSAGAAPGVDVQFTWDQCLLLDHAGSCMDAIPAGDGTYSSIASMTLVSIAGPIPDDGVLLFFSGINTTTTPYDPTDIAFVLDPDPVSGFVFTPLETIVLARESGSTYYYLGYRLLASDIGRTFTFRYDVNALQLAEGTPEFYTSAAYSFVPEPGTALLLAVGLAGLALSRRR